MKRDNIAGYEWDLCLKCTNSDGSAVHDNWKFKLNPPHQCLSSMTAPTAVDKTLSFKKLSESDPQVIWPVAAATDWDSIFSNDLVTYPECVITSCSISDAGNCGSGTLTN